MIFGRTERFTALIPSMIANGSFLTVGLVAVLQARFHWERQVNPAVALTPRAWRGAWICGAFLLALWGCIGLTFRGRVLGLGLTHELAITAGVTLAWMAYLTWGWAALLRWSGIIRPASDRLRAIVASIAEWMNVRPKGIEKIALRMANALSFVLGDRIPVTDAALADLDDEELAVLCAYELAHLDELCRVRIARFVNYLIVTFWPCSPALFMLLVERAYQFEASFGLYVGAILVSCCGAVYYARVH